MTASYIYSMDADEIEWMTRAMVKTGDQISFDTHPVMDHHSIGGVPGNKISLDVVPIVAAAGLLIPKTSSRAITGAGGSADLMEILCPVSFRADEIKKITTKVGGCLVWGGATNIAPADDKIISVEYPLSIDPRVAAAGVGHGQEVRRRGGHHGAGHPHGPGDEDTDHPGGPEDGPRLHGAGRPARA